MEGKYPSKNFVRGPVSIEMGADVLLCDSGPALGLESVFNNKQVS